jgi:hypothetical protein
MKTKILIMMIVSVGISNSCSYQTKHDNALKEKLLNYMENSIKSDSLITFKLDTITNFQWDYGLILLPYTDVDYVTSQINVDLRELKETGIKSSDNKTILAFIQENHLIKYIEYPRYPGDFAGLGSYIIYKTFEPNTIFRLTRTDHKTVGDMDYYIIVDTNSIEK